MPLLHELDITSQVSYCTLGEEECVSEATEAADDCLVSCYGLYADIQHTKETATKDNLMYIIEGYTKFKDQFSKSMVFDPASDTLSKYQD